MCVITAAEYEALMLEAMKGREGRVEKVYRGCIDAMFDDWGSTKLLRSRFPEEDQHLLASGQLFWMENGRCRLRRDAPFGAREISEARLRCERGEAPCGYHQSRIEIRDALNEYRVRSGDIG